MDIVNTSYHQKITHFLETHLVIYQFLRFGCIGFLNTGLNFLVINIISKFLHISQGRSLGAVVGVGFVCAVLQSYPWNRTWTFGGETGISLWENLTRLFMIGCLGASALVFVAIASGQSAPAWVYLIFLIAFVIVEDVLWKNFGFHMSDWNHVGHSFLIFFSVTLIGLFINSSLSSVVSIYLHPTNIIDLDKNIAVALATGVAMFWNFIGYKVVVFKK